MRRGGLLSAVCAALAFAATASAQMTTVENFESYASDAALRAAWVPQAPLPPGNVTLVNPGIDGQSMSITYNVAGGANTVEFNFGSDQNFTLRTTVRILYQVVSGSNAEIINFQFLDNANNILISSNAPDGTSVASAKWEFNLVPISETLTNVRKIRLSIVDGGDMDGEGVVLFDDISISSGTYSTCRSCHGEFVGKPYVAFTDGATWMPDLHDIHRFGMLNGDCNTCHTGNTFFPVFIGSSNGGTGLPGIGCLGCHGREADLGHDNISPGRAAGLNQHHHLAGVTECAKCHSDADPANYQAVGENVLPAYYFTPDAAHPNKPIAPCTASERFVSPLEGLDNDGDQLYEAADPDCQSVASVPAVGTSGLAISLALLLVLGIWRLRTLKRRPE